MGKVDLINPKEPGPNKLDNWIKITILRKHCVMLLTPNTSEVPSLLLIKREVTQIAYHCPPGKENLFLLFTPTGCV